METENRSMIQKLKSLSDHVILQNTTMLVERERKNTLLILHHLREVEKRKLYTRVGYKSLWEYCIKELRYSEAAAHRRISSMRLLRELPEMEEKLNSGEISLTMFSKAANFFKQEARVHNEFPSAKKKEVLHSLAGKSITETERELVRFSKQPAGSGRERVRVVSQALSEIRFFADQNLLSDLEQLKGLLAHTHPSLSMAELIAIVAQIALKKLDPARQPIRQDRTHSLNQQESAGHPNRQKAQTTSVGEVNAMVEPQHTTKHHVRQRRVATARQRKIIFKRDGGRCVWRNPENGERCNSRYMLQLDHVQPFALGGKTDVNNLRLLCAEHNQMHRFQCIGAFAADHPRRL